MRARRLPVLGLAVLCCPAVMAQDGAARILLIEPSISVLQTFTNNVDLVATGEKSESITQISPGIRLTSQSGRVRGSLNYSLSALVHASDSSRNTWQNALNANLNAELVEQIAFIDARANISQQTISAFGTQAGGTGLRNDNVTEVASFSVTPSLRSSLGGYADLRASATWTTTNAVSTDLGDGTTISGAVGLSGGRGRFGWGLDLGIQNSDYNLGDSSTRDQAFGTLRFAPYPELQLSLRGGIEGEDIRSGSRTTTDFWGYGITWQPGERTSAALQSDQRFFGRSHSLSFQHRMAQSVWSYSDSRSLNDPGGSGDPLNASQSRAVTNFDLFFAQFASLEPDPVKRAQLVRGFLQANGIDPNGTIGGGFLGSGQTVERRQNLSVGLIGVRTTVTLSGFRGNTEPVEAANVATGDLTKVGRVRQSGYSVGVSHRLTPISSVAVSGSQLRTLNEPSQPGTEQRLFNLIWSGELGRRTSGSVGLRYTQFESQTGPYDESAIFGSISFRF